MGAGGVADELGRGGGRDGRGGEGGEGQGDGEGNGRGAERAVKREGIGHQNSDLLAVAADICLNLRQMNKERKKTGALVAVTAYILMAVSGISFSRCDTCFFFPPHSTCVVVTLVAF